MTKNPCETLQISGNVMNKNEASNLKYIQRKKKRINSITKEKNNFYIDTQKIEENEIIHSDEFNYEIIGFPKKDKLIKRYYEYILKLNDDEKKNALNLEKILFKEKIKIKLILFSPIIEFHLNGESIVLEKKARVITFIDEERKKKYKKFIFSSSNLLETFKQLDFQSYYIKVNDNNEINYDETSANSTISLISLDNYCNIFNQENITEIFKYNTNPIFNQKNFINRIAVELKFLKDLSNTSHIYYRNKKDNEFIKPKQYDEIFYLVQKFVESYNTKILYLFGPKGVSKTTFLFFSKNILLKISSYSIYLDYFYLNENKNEYEKIKKILFYELLYSFSNYDELCLFEKEKIFHSVEPMENTLSFICQFLKKFLEILKTLNIKNRIVIIIDNIHLLKEEGKDDENDFFLSSIISLNNCCFSNVKIILSGSGKFFNEKFLKLYKNYQFQRFTYPESGYYLSINEEDLKSINSIKLFDNKDIENVVFNDYDKKRISEEENYLDKYSLIGLFHTDELDKKALSRNFILENMNIIINQPLEYFDIKISNNSEICFNYFSPLYKEALKRKVGDLVKIGALNTLLKDKTFPRTGFGICFEKVIALLLINNKIDIINLSFTENNIKEIQNISDLEIKDYQGAKFVLGNKNNPILLTQANYYGPNYDLLIIIKNEGINYSDFIQIGANKTNKEILDILENLKKNEKIIEANIRKIFGKKKFKFLYFLSLI